VKNLSHADATPFVVSFACDTGNFQRRLSGCRLAAAPSGAIAFWGSHDLAHWKKTI